MTTHIKASSRTNKTASKWHEHLHTKAKKHSINEGFDVAKTNSYGLKTDPASAMLVIAAQYFDGALH